MDANMQCIINSFRKLFHDKIFSLTFPWFFSKISDSSLTAVKFPDISRFSRQVVTLYLTELWHLLQTQLKLFRLPWDGLTTSNNCNIAHRSVQGNNNSAYSPASACRQPCLCFWRQFLKELGSALKYQWHAMNYSMHVSTLWSITIWQ